MGLAEWWADLQNLHPQIFLNFNPCANFQTLDISYNVCSAHCSLFVYKSECVTTVSWVLWSQWACHMYIRLLCHYGGRWPAWLWVRDYGWERQRGSKQGRYIQADCAVPGLTAEVRRLTAIAITWCSWQGEWSRRERRVITTELLSVATSNTINDQRLLHSRSVGLQPCKFGCSAGYILPNLGYLFH